MVKTERRGENMPADEWAAHFATFMDSAFLEFWNCVFGGDYTNPELRELRQMVSIDAIFDEIAKTGVGRLFDGSRFQKGVKPHARSHAPISFT